MLTASELASMRDVITNNLLPDTCNILQLTIASDGAGGSTETWGTATAGTAVACRVDYLQGRESVSGGAILPYQKAIISMPYDVTIGVNNRLEVGVNVFSIQAVNNSASWCAVKRISGELIP